jgi:dUTP pyrophosphatase
VKHGLAVGADVVDPDYKGELKVVLFNHDVRSPFVIRPGYRIAQLIVQPYFVPEIVEVAEP